MAPARAARGLAFGLLVLVSACGPRSRPGGDAAQTTLTIAIRADVTGFFPNPPIANEAFTVFVNRSIFEPLVGFDRGLQLVPRLAEQWENPDNRTYIFRLRRGVRFSDGSLLTPEDVAASLLAPRERRWVTQGYLRSIESVRILSPDRIEVRADAPNLTLLTRLPWGFVLPARALDRDPVPTVGTGPYRLESRTVQRGFVFTRNREFWGPRPPFERVRFLVVPDDDQRIARVESGEAQIADHVPFSALERLQKRSDLRVEIRNGLRVLFLGLGSSQAPFTDARVREAIDLAIDRQELNRRALAGRAQPATQLVPPSIIGFNPDIPAPRFDPGRARRLLASAGLSAGFALRLDGPNNRYVNDVGILNEVARQLGAIGIQVTVNPEDKQLFYQRLGRNDSVFHLSGWLCESGDAGDALDFLFRSRGSATGPTGSADGVGDPELERLIDAVHLCETETERATLLQEALARAAALRTILPLVIETEAVVLSRRILWDPPLTMALNPEDMRPAP